MEDYAYQAECEMWDAIAASDRLSSADCDRANVVSSRDSDVSTFADEHEGGQLRIAVAGEQMPLLALSDELIPTTDEPQAVDDLR